MIVQASENIKEIILRKEGELLSLDEGMRKLEELKEISCFYILTDVEKAETYLKQLNRLATKLNKAEYIGYCHLYQSTLENQIYNYDWALSLLKKAELIFEREGAVSALIELYINLASTYSNKQEYEESETHLSNASRLLGNHPEPRLKARLLYTQAMLYNRQFIYDVGFNLLLEARAILENPNQEKNIHDFNTLSKIYTELGAAFERASKLEEAIAARYNAIFICESFGFGMRLAWLYLFLGNAFRTNDENAKAAYCYKQAIEDAPEDASQYARAGASANLGHLYFMEGNYGKAHSMYEHAEDLYSQRRGSADDYNYSVLARFRGQLAAALGEEEEAMEHFENSLSFAVKSDNYRQMANVYKDLADYYSENGDYKKAYENHVRYEENKDRHIEETNQRAINELEVKYDIERKERETEMLKLQANELQLKALRAQMNPHFIFNALNSIQSHISGEDTKHAEVMFSKFSKLIRSSLEYSEFSAIPLEEEIQFLEDYLQIEKERFEGAFNYIILTSDDLEEDIMGIPPMIMQPYIENCIKHGVLGVDNGFIKIQFSMADEDTLFCVIEDNGVGRKLSLERQRKISNRNHRSMGTSITQDRLELINQSSSHELVTRTIDLKDELGNPKGTRIELHIPVMDIDPKFYQKPL